ncbi:hypothetical protein Hanom_Chr04g00297221 [Helianthus anomalus]
MRYFYLFVWDTELKTTLFPCEGYKPTFLPLLLGTNLLFFSCYWELLVSYYLYGMQRATLNETLLLKSLLLNTD